MSKQDEFSLKAYFTNTRSLLYSYLCSLPLLVIYEVLINYTQPGRGPSVRLAVDIWFMRLVSFVGYPALDIILILAALAGLYVLFKERSKLPHLKLVYFLGLAIEAFVYAVALMFLLSAFVGILLQIVPPGSVSQLPLLERIALSVGAGLYEELFFRVLLVTGFIYLFKLLFDQKWVIYTVAILSASCIFSLVHYLGALGDPFTLRSFVFRLLFGVALSIIYWWRGFGAAAWTHSIYDLLVTILA
jgi:membrane protease YdiL (CAAX protease family)